MEPRGGSDVPPAGTQENRIAWWPDAWTALSASAPDALNKILVDCVNSGASVLKDTNLYKEERPEWASTSPKELNELLKEKERETS